MNIASLGQNATAARLPNLLSILLCLSIGLVTPSVLCQSRWHQKEFILGTFHDPPINIQKKNFAKDSASFALAKNAYFNLLTGTQGDGRIDHSLDGMRYSLQLAAAVGLKYLVTDRRIYEGFEKPYDTAVARQVAKDYRSLPSALRAAQYGYFLCDEPQFRLDHLNNVSGWNSLISQLDPEKLVLVNLAPSYSVDADWGGFSSGNSNGILDANERADYELYLRTYITRLKPKVVSFDHFPFFKDGAFRHDYFYNLNIVRNNTNKAAFWACPMTVGHSSYVDPTEAHIRFMYFCPIAYGAKGLCVFSFFPPPEEGYRSALFDQQGNKTQRYEIVRQLNLYVSQVVGPVVMRVPNVGVFHASIFPPNQTGFDGSDYLSSSLIKSVSDSRILIGLFQNSQELYLFVVNKDVAKVENVSIKLRRLVRQIFLAPRVMDFSFTSSRRYEQIETYVQPKQNSSTFVIPELEGGEGRMVKVAR